MRRSVILRKLVVAVVVVAVHVSYNPLLVAFVVFATLEVLAVKSVAVICCSISVRRRHLRCWLLSRSTSLEGA